MPQRRDHQTAESTVGVGVNAVRGTTAAMHGEITQSTVGADRVHRRIVTRRRAAARSADRIRLPRPAAHAAAQPDTLYGGLATTRNAGAVAAATPRRR